MTRKIFIPILTTVALAVMTSCGGDSPKSRISHSIREISHSMREYTRQTLQPGESFEFIGLSNQRDTIYMGVTRPCAGVIYKINDSTTATSTRHFADVIFSNDFKVVLNVTELDFDPIEYTQEKVRDGFRQALDQLKNR